MARGARPRAVTCGPRLLVSIGRACKVVGGSDAGAAKRKGRTLNTPVKRRLTLAALWVGLAAIASLAAARTGVVTTTDGQTFEGDVSEGDGMVRVDRGGLSSTIERGRVTSIDYATYAERFDRDLAALPETDVAGRVALARQAFDRAEYVLASRAVGAALDINPLDRDARRLNAVISRQLALPRSTGPATTRAGAPAKAAPAPRRREQGLDEAQVNAVRLNELRQDDRVRIRFSNNVRKRFADAQPGMSYQQFAAFNDTEQALAILTGGTRDQVDDLRVMSDPRSVQTYTRRINGAIVQGCATSLCHGGEHSGAFRLLTGVPDPATAITNFYLLATYVRPAPTEPGSIFGGGELEMISRGRAVESLLVQYALPRANARVKHPIVRGWDGLFRTLDDRMAREFIEWINLDLSPFRPDYGFDFSLPYQKPATAPADTDRARRVDAAGDGGMMSARGAMPCR